MSEPKTMDPEWWHQILRHRHLAGSYVVVEDCGQEYVRICELPALCASPGFQQEVRVFLAWFRLLSVVAPLEAQQEEAVRGIREALASGEKKVVNTRLT